MDEFNITLIEEIISAAANLELDANCSVEYVGLSFDAFIEIKKELENSLDRTITSSDINRSLTIDHFIVPGLVGINYKFFKEISFEQ